MSFKLHTLQAFGVEIEYMIVNRETLDVRPLADRLIHMGNARKNEVSKGRFKWSNELVAHVVEIKTNGPVASLESLHKGFQEQVAAIEKRLEPLGCRLMPTGMHPWMDPSTQTVLWPYEDKEIYETFDRVFGCKGHGWSNLQSTHLNLSFSGDEEFRRLHSAIRLVLPLIPSLAASSPIMEGTPAPNLDQRLDAYGKNCAIFPSVSARLVPDVIPGASEYEERVYGPIQKDLESVGAQEVLEPVWVNARGAIARFDRGSIEIRLMDAQECPKADIEILRFLIKLLKSLVKMEHTTLEAQESIPTEFLADLLAATIQTGGKAAILDPAFPKLFGIDPAKASTARDLVRELNETSPQPFPHIRTITNHGTLSERLMASTSDTDNPEALQATYSKLADCLAKGTYFDAG
jgi:carboxylate-amine ligase